MSFLNLDGQKLFQGVIGTVVASILVASVPFALSMRGEMSALAERQKMILARIPNAQTEQRAKLQHERIWDAVRSNNQRITVTEKKFDALYAVVYGGKGKQ